MKIVQINLNHCEAAQDLLSQTTRELKADVAIICEQYRNPNTPTWVHDPIGSVAVWACGEKPFQDQPNTVNSGFVRVKVDGIHIYSCYAPPSASNEDFTAFLDRLVEDARGRNPLIIAGDFNAWADEWGSKHTNRRGSILLEAFSSLQALLLNSGNTPTFRRGNASSIVDLTFISSSLLNLRTTWYVSEFYSHSDHQAVIFEICRPGQEKIRKRIAKDFIGWKNTMFDEKIFVYMLEDLTLTGTAADKVTQLTKGIAKACDASMPRRSNFKNRPPAYWWSEEIADLRRKCNQARRLYQRAGYSETLHVQYRNARSNFKEAIKISKRKWFNDLCSEVDRDPWGRPYQTVMAKLKFNKAPRHTCPIMLNKIVQALFPSHSEVDMDIVPTYDEDIPPITEGEVLAACKKIGNKKAPGPDFIPNVALKTAMRTYPDKFADMYNSCLKENVFPERWKLQRLVLLPKGNKPPDEPSSHRPLCMINTIGKVMERFICNRLEEAVERAGNLSNNQYGFRKARSTIDAIKIVVETAEEAISGKRWRRGTKKYCAVVTLDIENAFNSANWGCILRSMQRMNIPNYLIQIVAEYFRNRRLIYNTDDGQKLYKVSGGVPQGSVLGPLLWNILYDGVLRLKIPDEAKIVGFADDIAVVVVAKMKEDVEQICNETIETIGHWLSSTGLRLANHKTEAVLISSRKHQETIKLDIGEHQVISQPTVRYLGVMIDTRLTFKTHLEVVSSKASKIYSVLSRILPNTGGAKQSRRTLLANVVTSILLYGAPIWASAMDCATYKRKMRSIYRLCALRVACAFRTVSDEAVFLVTGMCPVDILAQERRRTYLQKDLYPKSVNRMMASVESIQEWQQRWDSSSKGRWTFRLIPKIEAWQNRKFGEVDYHLTQFLTGHGCFRAYLFRFGHEVSPDCPVCIGKPENVEHVFFQCPRFEENRMAMSSVVGGEVSPENVIPAMMANEESWSNMSEIIATVMTDLRRLERLRREMEWRYGYPERTGNTLVPTIAETLA